jgi:hypothetical protein
LSVHDDRRVFERALSDPAFAEIEADPHTGAFGHPAIHGNHDMSFVVRSKDVSILNLPMCAPIAQKLDHALAVLRNALNRGDIGQQLDNQVIRPIFTVRAGRIPPFFGLTHSNRDLGWRCFGSRACTPVPTAGDDRCSARRQQGMDVYLCRLVQGCWVIASIAHGNIHALPLGTAECDRFATCAR